MEFALTNFFLGTISGIEESSAGAKNCVIVDIKKMISNIANTLFFAKKSSNTAKNLKKLVKVKIFL